MTTVYRPIEFCIDNLLAQGLYILAGAPKVGKSWLALDMCLSIAKGEKVLGQQTTQGTALYLCLEDSYVRIQNRLYEITDEPAERLHFVIMSESIGNGLEEEIENFKNEHYDFKVVFIDTLQKVRNESESGYGTDYKELSVMKALADKLEITIVVVHHTRKCADSDPFNMIWFCQYHLTHFIRTRIMQRERYDHSRAFFGLPEADHRWRCRFFCWPSNS